MLSTKVRRITKAKQFSFVKKYGEKLVYPPFIILFVKENNLAFFNVGFIVSSKVGNAVVRNKIKRRLKSISMTILNDFNVHGFSVCIIARSPAYDLNFDKMKSLFTHAVKKITS